MSFKWFGILFVFVAPQLKIAENRMTVTGEKGYCMIRATHGELSLQCSNVKQKSCPDMQKSFCHGNGNHFGAQPL